MGVRFEQCKNVTHAEQCHEAGLLYLNYGLIGEGTDWQQSEVAHSAIRELYNNESGMWPPSEFAICLED